MENILNWMNLAYVVGGAIIALIPTIIALISAVKARINAKSEAEKAEALNTLKEKAQELITTAEKTYADVDKVFKSQGSSAGVLKKDIVLTKLKGYAVDQGYSFDEEYWSNAIDSIVALTREVNCNK